MAFVSAWRLIVACVVGKRTQENAHRLLQCVVAVTDAHITYARSWVTAPMQIVTSAMAARRPDGVWTTAELLGYRVPATFLDKLDELEQLFPDPDSVHHVN